MHTTGMSVGSSIASGMASAITTGHPTSNYGDETQELCLIGVNERKCANSTINHVIDKEP
jgi:hypothetical protein